MGEPQKMNVLICCSSGRLTSVWQGVWCVSSLYLFHHSPTTPSVPEAWAHLAQTHKTPIRLVLFSVLFSLLASPGTASTASCSLERPLCSFISFLESASVDSLSHSLSFPNTLLLASWFMERKITSRWSRRSHQVLRMSCPFHAHQV